MKGIIFDLDGVLVDSMPSHVKAWRKAFEKVAGLSVSEKEIYRLEGMRGKELIERIFDEKSISDSSLVDKVSNEKDKIFRQSKPVKPFEGASEIIEDVQCSKAVVSGSGRRDVLSILDGAFGSDKFDVIITADDVKKGKPDPSSFIEAAMRMRLDKPMAVIIENAPLGAQASNNAGIRCYVALNNTPLSRSDFAGIISEDSIFDTTGSLKAILTRWCQ